METAQKAFSVKEVFLDLVQDHGLVAHDKSGDKKNFAVKLLSAR